MMENNSSNRISTSENDWENLDTFFADFAKSNEEMEQDILSGNPDSENITPKMSKRTSSTQNREISYNEINNTKLAAVSRKLISENHINFSDKYNGLHSDVKNLLLELQEIKKARISLQEKLDSIR